MLPQASSSVSFIADSSSLPHGIQIRLRTSAITRQDYSALAATFLEVQSLVSNEDHQFSSGFTFIANMTDSAKPSTFKTASQLP